VHRFPTFTLEKRKRENPTGEKDEEKEGLRDTESTWERRKGESY